MPASSDPAHLALDLAALGWHILPLSAVSKRPLGNCDACRPRHGIPVHLAGACPCLPAGGWCHGVRAATTGPAAPGAGDACTPPVQLADGCSYRTASRHHRAPWRVTGRHPPPPLETPTE